VQIWSDIACPWAALAVTRLRSARAALNLELDVRLEHRAFPLEYANDGPLVRADGEAVELLGGDDDFPAQPWSGDSGQWPSSSVSALAAVRAAGTDPGGAPDLDRLAVAEDLDWALRRALLVESRPVGTDEEVLAVAGSVPGLDVDALREALPRGRNLVAGDWRLVPDLSISGSPYLRLADGTTVFNPGADSAYDWEDLLRRALSPEG
jgi:predicted DsbA family dithiol-disulfide isomerase